MKSDFFKGIVIVLTLNFITVVSSSHARMTLASLYFSLLCHYTVYVSSIACKKIQPLDNSIAVIIILSIATFTVVY